MGRVRFAWLLAMLLVPAARSDAAPIVYDFTVTFIDGALAGESVGGSFSVDGADCPGGTCEGDFFTPGGPQTLLSFDITVDGNAFDETDDVRFPTAPILGFSSGNVAFIDYLGTLGSGLPLFHVGLISDPSAVFIDEGGSVSRGLVSNIRRHEVPEPATLLMFSIGATTACARMRRRKRLSQRYSSAVRVDSRNPGRI